MNLYRNPFCRWSLLNLVVLILAGFGLAESRGQVITGFETTDGGYVNGGSLTGVTDTSAGAAWGSAASITASNLNPYQGAQAVRINDTSTSLAGGDSLNLANSASLLNAPFRFQVSFAVGAGYSTGTNLQFFLEYGGTGAANNKDWVRINFDNDILRLYTGDGLGGVTGANLGLYTNYSDFGGYVSFDLVIDPVTHKYTQVIVSGAKTTINWTSTITSNADGGAIPWTASAGNPGTMLNLITGSNDTIVVDVDALSVTAIPEPGAISLLLLGVGALARVGRMRRLRNHR